jgi:Flp pilus assembly protein TadG
MQRDDRVTTRHAGRQRGAAIVEFAIVCVVFLTLLLSIMDFGRILFTWSAAAEATRWGARVAVVCDKLTPDQVRDKMRKILADLTNANIQINYYNPEGTVNNTCDASTCKGVEVKITAYSVQPISPLMGIVMPPVPAFATYLPRESMQAINAQGDQNPVCFM